MQQREYGQIPLLSARYSGTNRNLALTRSPTQTTCMSTAVHGSIGTYLLKRPSKAARHLDRRHIGHSTPSNDVGTAIPRAPVRKQRSLLRTRGVRPCSWSAATDVCIASAISWGKRLAWSISTCNQGGWNLPLFTHPPDLFPSPSPFASSIKTLGL